MMPGSPYKVIRFWQELKRRNVVRRNTVYAATAFVILELVSIIQEPLRLPGWTLTLVIILLSIGFVVSIILSWFFDFNAEGVLERTAPINKQVPEQTKGSASGWKIATITSFILIVGLIILHLFPRAGKPRAVEKSLAVLPFINDSPEEEGMYFINGTMESILDNLSKIHDLRVVSRTSVEQYRNNLKPVPEIAQEMNVAYVLEGSGLKHGDQIRLTLQLIDAASDTHIWSNSYNKSEEEVFELYSDVAKSVASAIMAVITPEEQERIDKIPTTSTTAYELYKKAMDVGEKKAIELLYYALEYDSTFALPYIELGWKYFNRYQFNPDLNREYLDSAKRMVGKALRFDPQSADAHSLNGYLCRLEGKREEALRSFDRAIELNSNLVSAYSGKGWLYFGEMDYISTIDNFQQCILRDRTPENLGDLNDKIGFVLAFVGLSEMASQYYDEALKWSGDTATYLRRQAQNEQYAGNGARAIELALESHAKDLKRPYTLAVLGENYMLTGRYKESFHYFNKYVEYSDSTGWGLPWHKMQIAFIYRENGYNEKAQELIDLQIRQSEESITEFQSLYTDHYSYLAMAYMLKGEKEKAIEYLKLISLQSSMNATLVRYHENPIFSGIKDDPDFQEICDQILTKYLAEQERVRQWMEAHK
jgi:TolB-like protein/Tfp pilus assembly protein PilF